MVNLRRIAFTAALLIGIAAALPSLGLACQPCSALGDLPASVPGNLPDLIEENLLEPVTEQMETGVEVLERVEDYAERWRELKEEIAERIDRIVPLEGRESGGVRQLHPLRGTCLIRKDYAQQTLEEDWFLKPSLGTAALHLDVPYDADVKVIQRVGKDGTKHETTSVRSRGRYRHLVLRNVPQTERREVTVEASLWTTDPKCDAEMTPVCKKVYLQAGDRRYLQFTEKDFEDVALASLVQPTGAAAAIASSPLGAAPARAPARVRARTPARRGTMFEFAPVPLYAFVEYPDRATEGGQARSFTFAKAKKTPETLTLIHKARAAEEKFAENAQFDVRLILTWRGVTGRVEVFVAETPSRVALKFQYDDSNRGKAELPFVAAGFRDKIQQTIPQRLSSLDSPKTIDMVAEIKELDKESATKTPPVRISLR